MEKHKRMICAALFLFALILGNAAALAAQNDTESRIVKVGYMNHPGYIEKGDDGKFYGCGVEYLNEISQYTGWKIEYVYASWVEQLEMLERGEIDIVPMVQYSEERAKRYLYTHQPAGIIQGLLITLPEGQNNISNNALACDGRTIGIQRGSKNIDFLEKYAKQMGFKYHLVEYDFQNQLEEALLAKEVEIIACEQMIQSEGLRVLDRFASDPYYFITSNNNADLMEKLDYTISKIYAYDPAYAVKLHQKYYGNGLASSRPYFSKAEMEYLESHKEISIALVPDNQPLAYRNDEGEAIGVIPDIMSRVSEFCGIEFKYVYIPKDMTPLAFLQENPVYIATGMLASNPAFNNDSILMSDVYYTTYAALVEHSHGGEKKDIQTENCSIGTAQSFQAMKLFIKENYPNLQIEEYLSIEDGLKSLEREEIDLFAYTTNMLATYLANPLYGDISIVDGRFMPCPLCTIAINSPENELLIGIMNKCISMIPDAEIAQLEGYYLQQSVYHYNDHDVLKRYQTIILLIAFLVALIVSVLLLLLLMRQRRFNRDITIHAEYDMMTGLYNRATMKEKVKLALEQYTGKQCALLIIDIDDLKRINDTNGHAVGDEVVKAVANIIKNQFGGYAIIGRIGGDDIAVFLSGMESKSVLVSILARLQRTVAATTVANVTTALSVSVGVAMFMPGECGMDEMHRRADEALNCVKSNGKNGFSFYSAQKTMAYKAIYQKRNGEYLTDDEPVYPIYNEQQANQEVSANILDSHTDCDSDFRKLIEAFPNVALYVIEQKTHRVLYYNKRFREICPNISVGMSCRGIMVGPCQNCIVDTMGEQSMAHTIFYSDAFGDEVEITATKIIWKDTIPAVMISSWPRTVLTSSNDKLPKASNQDSFDYVTGGLTRHGFISMMERMQNGGVDLTEYAVLFINIQDFKAVNELVGSEGGDNLLRTVFARIEQSDFSPVIGARKESDHFVYLVEKSALDLTKLPELINFHWQYDEKDLFILSRCGIFMIEDSNLEIYKMIDRAKLAKAHIVDEYIKPYAVYESSMLKEYSEKAEAFLLFDQGIKNNEFLVYYQPIVDAKTEKIVSAEALVRRRTADGAIVSSGKFIPILERTGYISMLDRFVGNEVRNFQHKRITEKLPIVPISFNLSQKDFYDTELMEQLALGFESGTFPKGSILLEITEGTYTLNEKKHEELLKRLREAGAQILLDDFGTGYSSFGMFENYNFDRVKLDMSFVRRLEKNENVRQVVESIISMCHKLGIKVVAEGVETETELSVLRGLDCDYIQGYYFSKPLDEQSFVDYLQANSCI